MTSPTLIELFNSISNSFKNEFGIQSENDLKRVLTAIASTNAGMLKLFYLALVDVQKNVYPDLAAPAAQGGTLERFGRLKLGRDPNPAIQGQYTALVSGVEGTTLNIGTQFSNKITGNLYTTIETVVIPAGGEISVNILADKAGAEFELEISDEIFTVNTIANIDSLAIVQSVVQQALDAETIEDYRDAVTQSFRLEPNGGSASDYVFWALDVAGLRTVYPYTTPETSGSVVIYAEALPGVSTDGNGTCPQSLLDALWKSDYTGVFELDPDTTLNDYERGRRQLGLNDITVSSVTPLPVVVTIQNLKNQSQYVKDSIENELNNVLYLIRPYVAGVGDINQRKDTLYYNNIISAIDEATDAGNTYDGITVTVNGNPLPFQFLLGNIPYLSEVVYE